MSAKGILEMHLFLVASCYYIYSKALAPSSDALVPSAQRGKGDCFLPTGDLMQPPSSGRRIIQVSSRASLEKCSHY